MRMKHIFHSSSLSTVFLTIIFLLIFNSCKTFGEKDVVLKAEKRENSDNITAEKLVLSNGPTLLGIFADDVDDSENSSIIYAFNNNKIDNKLFSDNKEINETISLIEKKRSIVVNGYENISALVPQNDKNNSISDNDILINGDGIEDHKQSDQLNKTQIYNINGTQLSLNESQRLHLCKQFGFEANKTQNDSNLCLLSGFSFYANDPAFDPTMVGGGGAAPSDRKVNNVIPFYFYIPEPNEIIDEKSYIEMKVQICCEPKGQLLIFDERSSQFIFSYSNEGTAYMCNHGPYNHQSFVSDSNKLRVEYVLPFGEIGEEESIFERSYSTKDNPGEVHIKYEGFEMKIVYFEIPFLEIDPIDLNPEILNQTDHIEAVYLQNSVITYMLHKLPKDNKKVSFVGVEIFLEYLDIDIDSGDFLLIGPGLSTTYRHLSKSQIISQNIDVGQEPMRIWVDADSAYIRLVTHNSLKKPKTALRFSWTPANTTVDDNDDEKISLRLKNSAIQICIMKYGCQNLKNIFVQTFIDELVHIVNDYLTTVEHEISSLVSGKQVLLFSYEDKNRNHENNNEIFCQTNLAIRNAFDDQLPMFSSNTLRNIFFGGYESKTMHSFGNIKVTDCTNESISFWKMILPIVIILIVSLLLMLIAWRYQYNNWMRTQRSEKANYMSGQINDDNEDTLFEKDTKSNPLYVETPLSSRKTNAFNNNTNMTDGYLITNNENEYNKQISQTSDQNEPLFENERHFEESLWANPSTSQDPPEYNDQMQPQIIDNSHHIERNQITRDIPDISISSDHRSLSTTSDTIPSRVNAHITGLHGTQHESLRAYPRSALRRPRTISENEYVIGPEMGSLNKSSKVQFELPLRPQPKRSPLLERDSIVSITGHENIAFVNE